MKDFGSTMIGIIIGLALSMPIHEFSSECSKSGEIKTAKKIIPTTVITQTEKSSDTLYIYTKID